MIFVDKQWSATIKTHLNVAYTVWLILLILLGKEQRGGRSYRTSCYLARDDRPSRCATRSAHAMRPPSFASKIVVVYQTWFAMDASTLLDSSHPFSIVNDLHLLSSTALHQLQRVSAIVQDTGRV